MFLFFRFAVVVYIDDGFYCRFGWQPTLVCVKCVWLPREKKIKWNDCNFLESYHQTALSTIRFKMAQNKWHHILFAPVFCFLFHSNRATSLQYWCFWWHLSVLRHFCLVFKTNIVGWHAIFMIRRLFLQNDNEIDS